MKPRPGFDPASLVSGVILIALGGLLPVLASLGGIFLACGLAGPPRGE